MITLRLDKNGGINKGDIKAFEHDNLSEVYIIQLYKDNAPYDLTNKTVELTIVEKKRKLGDILSLPVYEAATGKVKLEVVSAITKQDGIYVFKLTVKDTTGLIETFPNFQVKIENDITDSITGEIIQDKNFTILTEGLKALADYNIYKTNALKVPEIEQDIVEINEQLDTIAINILDYKTNNSWADAFNKAMVNGNKLYLPRGTYDFSGDYAEILFDGYELDFNDSVINNSSLLFRLKNSTIKNLTLTNRGVYINGSNCKLSNIRIDPSVPYSIPYGFNIITNDDTIENIIFENCICKNANIFGFNIMDESNSFTKGKVFNIKYINCQSINSGGDNIWGNGFCIEGIKEVANILYENCYADNSMESGFHCEDAVSIKNLIYNNCISTNNGTRKDQPTFGAGFFANTNIILNNCVTKNNYTPIYKGIFPNIINHIEGDSKYRFTQNSYSNGIIGGNFEYGLAPFGRFSLYSASFVVYQIRGMAKDCFEVLSDNNDFVLRNLKNAGSDLYERSLQTNIIKINQNKTYEVSFHQKRFSGTEGNLILAITEFDAYLNKVKSYSLNKGITISDDWNKEIFVVGKGTDTNSSICVFDERTEYIDISIVFNYLDTAPTLDNNSTVIKKLKFEEL